MAIGEVIHLRDPEQNGELTKVVLKEGEGTETAGVGCTVTVHYTGTLLDGSVFDSSRDRNEPLIFKLGKGVLIPAGDICIETMKKGEICQLTCAPHYAFGPQGNSRVPPNSTVQFEIELVDWELEDLSPNKTKGIQRLILNLGDQMGGAPADGAEVTVRLEGKLQDGTIFDNRTVTFPLGDGAMHNICSGIEKALEKSYLNNKSKLIIQPKYAFKTQGNKELGVPSNSVVEYIVELLSFEKTKDYWQMDSEELVEQAQLAKDKGTEYFKAQDYQNAIKKYLKAVNLIKDYPDKQTETEEIQSKAKELLIALNLNLALVYMKVPNYPAAIRHASQVLSLEPNNVKALYRKGQSSLEYGDFDEAIKCFQRVLEQEPQNKAAANQLTICRKEAQKQKKSMQSLYCNMFDKFAKHDNEVEKQRAKEWDVISDRVGEWGKGEGEWTDEMRDRKPTEFEKENPNILMLDKDGRFQNM